MTFRQQEFWRWAWLKSCDNARKAYRMIENAAHRENHVVDRMLLHASNSGVVPFGQALIGMAPNKTPCSCFHGAIT